MTTPGPRPVIAHARDWRSQQGQRPDLVCCIYPTAPFFGLLICAGADQLRASSKEFAFSLTGFEFPIQRAFQDIAGRHDFAQRFDLKANAMRSQDRGAGYHDAAQFYWGEGLKLARNMPNYLEAFRAGCASATSL